MSPENPGVISILDTNTKIKIKGGTMVFKPSPDDETSLTYGFDCPSGYKCTVKFLVTNMESDINIKAFNLEVGCGCGEKHRISMGGGK